MKDGCIVERGLHHELIQQDGLYRQIYDLQLRDQEQFHEEMETLAGSTAPALPPGKTRGWESA
jgi:ATP-binding cassette subfamily B protein